MRVVIDTDVASYLLNRRPVAAHYVDFLAGKDLAISFMTVAEMRFGALQANWGFRRRNILSEYLSGFAIYYPDNHLCTLWAEVQNQSKRKGRLMSVPDAWIAATALSLQVPLATNNLKHYSHLEDLILLGGPYEEKP